jgi:hypothetical protein
MTMSLACVTCRCEKKSTCSCLSCTAAALLIKGQSSVATRRLNLKAYSDSCCRPTLKPISACHFRARLAVPAAMQPAHHALVVGSSTTVVLNICTSTPSMHMVQRSALEWPSSWREARQARWQQEFVDARHCCMLFGTS